MAILTSAQFTLRDDTDIVIALTPPANAVKDMLWLDLGSNPIVLKRWGGAKGTIGSTLISSNGNSSWSTVEETIEITNAKDGFGIYNLTNMKSTKGEKKIFVNKTSVELSDSLNYNPPSPIVEISYNNGSLNFKSDSGDFWCPVNAEANGILAELQEVIDKLSSAFKVENDNPVIYSNEKKVVEFESNLMKISNINSIELFGYKVSKDENGNVSFDFIEEA